MGAFSEMQIELQQHNDITGGSGDAKRSMYDAASAKALEESQLTISNSKSAKEDTNTAAAASQSDSLAAEHAQPPDKTEGQISEEDARKAHEEAEALRKAEWETKHNARIAEEKARVDRLNAMSEDELIAASAEHIHVETERLTRRNMKECISEHLQMLCLEDLAFARLTMYPRKSFINCIRYINRKAREYLLQEMKDNGIEVRPGTDGVYGGDVPDELCYSWAEEYYRDLDAQEDQVEEEKFTPKPFVAPPNMRREKRAKKKAAPQKPPVKKPEAPKEKTEEQDFEDQISFGDVVTRLREAG